MTAPSGHIAILLRGFMTGGIQRVFLTLAGEFAARGYKTDILAGRVKGGFSAQVPEQVRVFDLQAGTSLQALPVVRHPGIAALPATRLLLHPHSHWILGAIPALSRYLADSRPDVLLSGTEWANIAAVLARQHAGVSTKLVISVHDMLSVRARQANLLQRAGMVLPYVKRYYPLADRIIAVSDGVARDTAAITGISTDRIATIYNPVFSDRIASKAADPVHHPWLERQTVPVILGVGRLKPEKDFPTLIRAFARVRARRQARLIILGSGWQRRYLQALAWRLGIAADVDLPGSVDNPWAWMARSNALVLTSLHEGFANVLVEAMACGCPVVSTACPGGPAEILNQGEFGAMAAVGDDAAVAEAILATLSSPPDKQRLQSRAAGFSIDAAVDRYLDVLLPRDP